MYASTLQLASVDVISFKLRSIAHCTGDTSLLSTAPNVPTYYSDKLFQSLNLKLWSLVQLEVERKSPQPYQVAYRYCLPSSSYTHYVPR